MELRKMLTAAREVLLGWGAVELPPHPGVLPSAWLHPDLFSRQVAGEEGQFFTVQPVVEGGCGCRRRGGAVGTLVWWRRPFAASWMARLPELLAALQPGGDTPLAAGFETVGRITQQGVWGETGCVWDIQWKGCRIGDVRVIAGVAGERSGTPAGVAVLNLESIAAVWSGDPALDRIRWDGPICTSDLAAWRQTGLCLDAAGEAPLRIAQARWERIRVAGEAALNGKCWLDAFLPMLDGASLLAELTTGGPAFETMRQACDGSLRTMCRRLVQIMPRREPAAGAAGKAREGMLR
ncbi:MAG TPA: hypothetical protein PLP29_17815 [Candidatus Ozemobacteraceae bacterium]|nr:hypothetical protein [Candidatus Ozemobacteraceae bacterium]